jgi:hypothetical protein
MFLDSLTEFKSQGIIFLVDFISDIQIFLFFKILVYWSSADFIGLFQLKGKSLKTLLAILSTTSVFSLIFTWGGDGCRTVPHTFECAPELCCHMSYISNTPVVSVFLLFQRSTSSLFIFSLHFFSSSYFYVVVLVK